MAVVYSEGFDAYSAILGSTATTLNTPWATTTGSLSLVAGRYGGLGLQVPNSNTSNATSPFWTGVSSFTLMASIVVEAASANHVFTLRSGATQMIGVTFPVDGSVQVERNTVLIASSGAGTFSTSTAWHTLVLSVVIHDTTGSVVLSIDGAELINVTGVDTRNGTPTTVDNIKVNGESAAIGRFTIDDLIITDSATPPSGEYYIESVPVNADGATLNWTPSTGISHFAVVDELPGSITDYLSASTVGNIDELDIGNLSSSPASILAVNFVGHFDKTDGAARLVALGVKSGATTSAGTNVALSTAGVRVNRLLNTDPDTATAWTVSGVQASKIRAEVTV